jgi:hypothetical protein
VSMDYIRRTYSVPASVGARVRFLGGCPDPEDDAEVKTREGVIVGARGQYLRVRFDGEKHPRTLHPLWRVEYLKPPNASMSGRC